MTSRIESRPARVARFQRHLAGLTLAIETLDRCLADVDLDWALEWHDDADDARGAAARW